jgi:hypothetical protein
LRTLKGYSRPFARRGGGGSDSNKGAGNHGGGRKGREDLSYRVPRGPVGVYGHVPLLGRPGMYVVGKKTPEKNLPKSQRYIDYFGILG